MTAGATRSLVHGSYQEPDTLAARASIYRYRTGGIDLRGAVMGLIDVRPDDRVVDIGCGEAPYFAALAGRDPAVLVGIDRSFPMLRRARTRAAAPQATFAQGDLDALPILPRSCDVVLATHCLYHAQDPPELTMALPGLLRPGGRLYIVLNGRHHLQEIRAIARDAGHPGLLGESARLTAEDADAVLADHREVTTTWINDELAITSADPIVAYVDSTRAMYEPQLPDGQSWDELIGRLTDELRERFRLEPVFRTRARSAVIECQ